MKNILGTVAMPLRGIAIDAVRPSPFEQLMAGLAPVSSLKQDLDVWRGLDLSGSFVGALDMKSTFRSSLTGVLDSFARLDLLGDSSVVRYLTEPTHSFTSYVAETKRLAVGNTHVEYADNIVAVHLRNRPRFFERPLLFLLGITALVKDLERDRPIKLNVASFIDGTHAALANAAYDDVLPDLRWMIRRNGGWFTTKLLGRHSRRRHRYPAPLNVTTRRSRGRA
jgi:hypothetical protein